MARIPPSKAARQSFRQSVVIDSARYPELAYLVDMDGWGVRAGELVRLARLGAMCEQQQKALLDQFSAVAQLQALAKVTFPSTIDPTQVAQLQQALLHSDQAVSRLPEPGPLDRSLPTANASPAEASPPHETPSRDQWQSRDKGSVASGRDPSAAEQHRNKPKHSTDRGLLDTFVL